MFNSAANALPGHWGVQTIKASKAYGNKVEQSAIHRLNTTYIPILKHFHQIACFIYIN